MRALLSRLLALLVVIGLIISPLVLTGYIELQRADTSEDNLQKSLHYQRAARLLPWRSDLWEKAGAAMYASGNSLDSISYLIKAKETQALSGFGWDLLGSAYWESGNRDSAINVWAQGLDAHPSYFEYYARLGMAYRENGDFAAEGDAIERWIEYEAEAQEDMGYEGEPSASMHYRLGQLLMLSDSERAQKEFRLAVSLDPQYDPVVDTLHTTLNLASIETDESRRLVIVGRGLGLVDEWPLASEAFRQAIAAEGANPEAWAWLGEAEQQLGRSGRAELDIALSLGHSSPIVRSLRGVYWTRQGQAEQALAEYLLAAEYDPDNPAWQISIGDAYKQNGDLQAALDAYVRAIEMAPSEATYWRLLAEFCSRYDMQVEEIGLPAAQMAVELTGEDPLALDALGWTLTLLERYEEASDVFEHALSLEPQLARLHLHLGILEMQQQDWESALTHIQQARDLDQGGQVGAQAQQLLDQYFP